MHVVQRLPRRQVVHGKRMYSPLERNVVSGVGLGGVDGLFDIGKMFSRLTHFTSSSFKLNNIMGAIGSLTAFTASGGLSSLAPKLTSAHSTAMKALGYGTVAVAAAAGGAALLATAPATGTGLTAVGTQASGSSIIGGITGTTAVAPASTGILSTIGSGISSIGSGLMNVVKALPFVNSISGMLSSGSGVQPQTQSDAYAQQYADQQQQAAQRAYDAQVAAARAAMYTPGYNPNIPYVSQQYAGPLAPSEGGSYGDLRSPYTAITEDGQQIEIDPATGLPISTGLSPAMIVGGGIAVVLLGLYLTSEK